MYTRKLKDQKKKLKRRKKGVADPDENIVLSKKILKTTRIFNEDYDGEYDDILKKYGY